MFKVTGYFMFQLHDDLSFPDLQQGTKPFEGPNLWDTGEITEFSTRQNRNDQQGYVYCRY